MNQSPATKTAIRPNAPPSQYIEQAHRQASASPQIEGPRPTSRRGRGRGRARGSGRGQGDRGRGGRGQGGRWRGGRGRGSRARGNGIDHGNERGPIVLQGDSG